MNPEYMTTEIINIQGASSAPSFCGHPYQKQVYEDILIGRFGKVGGTIFWIPAHLVDYKAWGKDNPPILLEPFGSLLKNNPNVELFWTRYTEMYLWTDDESVAMFLRLRLYD